MSIKGISRPLDKLGRLVIPSEIRRSLELQKGDTLDIYVHGGNLLLCSHKEPNQPTELPAQLVEELIQAANELSENDVLMFIDLIKRVSSNK